MVRGSDVQSSTSNPLCIRDAPNPVSAHMKMPVWKGGGLLFGNPRRDNSTSHHTPSPSGPKRRGRHAEPSISELVVWLLPPNTSDTTLNRPDAPRGPNDVITGRTAVQEPWNSKESKRCCSSESKRNGELKSSSKRRADEGSIGTGAHCCDVLKIIPGSPLEWTVPILSANHRFQVVPHGSFCYDSRGHYSCADADAVPRCPCFMSGVETAVPGQRATVWRNPVTGSVDSE